MEKSFKKKQQEKEELIRNTYDEPMLKEVIEYDNIDNEVMINDISIDPISEKN